MKYIIKKCIVCEREFLSRLSKGRGGSICNGSRGKKSITCSKLCSKIYNRIAQHIRAIEKQRKKEVKEEDVSRTSNKVLRKEKRPTSRYK